MKPGTLEPSSPSSCPACGRYTGPAFTCPYCEVELPGLTPLLILRGAAVLLAAAGLFLLVLLARHSPLPLTPIARISATVSERTRLRGVTITTPRVISRNGSPTFVSFDLEDATGRITVAATRRIARDLVTLDRLPQKGDVVDITGNPALDKYRRIRLYMDNLSTLPSPSSSL